MVHRQLDPRIVNIHLDNNALQHLDGDAVARLLKLGEGELNLIVPKGVRIEAMQPTTPAAARQSMGCQIFSLPVELNPDEKRELAAIKSVLQGNAKPGKHDADAEHLFEAGKYGGGYFITHDKRMIETKRSELASVLPPSLHIVTLHEFLAIYDEFVGRD